MKTYAEAVHFLYGLEKFGMKFGLRGIRMLLEIEGNPERTFPTIHVAGTNGKGSTSSMLAAIFTAAGYKTGLYTSPHLISFTERIRIDGKPIPQRAIVRLTNLLHGRIVRQKATFFEAVTAIAFRYFSEAGVDIAIIETGLGGRLDATNVLRPRVSVITNISLEDTEILGDTAEKIAYEKGGIIKRGIPCVTGVRSKRALTVLRTIAKKRKADLCAVNVSDIFVKKSSLNGLVVDVRVGKQTYRNLHVSLAGRHQAMNLGVVLRTLEVTGKQGEFALSERHIRHGLSHVQALAGLQARLSVVRRNPLVLVDVAHNPDGVRRLTESLRELGIRNVFLVFGVVRDKDYASMIRLLKPVTQQAILTAARTERARSISDLTLEFSRNGISVVGTEQDVKRAVAMALVLHSKRTPLLITGSHFVVGEALAALQS